MKIFCKNCKKYSIKKDDLKCNYCGIKIKDKEDLRVSQKNLEKILELKRRGILKVKCNSCKKISGGLFNKGNFLCSICMSSNTVINSPLITGEKSDKEINSFITEYKSLCKINSCLKEIENNLLLTKDEELKEELKDLYKLIKDKMGKLHG